MKRPNPNKLAGALRWVRAREMSFAASERTRVLNWVLNALTLGFLFLALVTLLLWFVPYPKMKVFLDSLAAVQNSNGRVTHPTEGGLHAFVARLPLASCLFVICAVALALLKCELRDFLLGIPPELPGIRKSLRDLFPPGIRTLQEIGAVLTVFGNRALSNYSYPNNHLFNTLLVHFSIRAFGDTTLALRLSALAAGCLTIPMSWLAGRALYGRLAGILTAGCVAGLPTFIEFSVNARGYATLLAPFLAIFHFRVSV